MCDQALTLRAAVRASLRQAFPDLRCFVRIAPAGHPWLLVSDAPRWIDDVSLRKTVEAWDLRFVIEKDLLYLDAPDAVYQEALKARCDSPMGAYCADDALLQATVILLLRHPAPSPNPARPKPLLREGWRAVALGEAQVRQWADDMRSALASGLRAGDPSGLFPCGVLLAAWLAKKEVALPMDRYSL